MGACGRQSVWVGHERMRVEVLAVWAVALRALQSWVYEGACGAELFLRAVCALVWTVLAAMDTFSRRCGYWHLRLLLGGVFGGRLHAHVGACWAAVFNAFHGRMCALVGALLRVLWAHVGACGWKCCVRSPRVCMWELVGAQLTFGCLDVAVISTRVSGVGMFLRRTEPASTLGAWAGLGSGCFFGVFPVFSRGFKLFSGGQRAPQAKAPHEVCWNTSFFSRGPT